MARRSTLTTRSRLPFGCSVAVEAAFLLVVTGTGRAIVGIDDRPAAVTGVSRKALAEFLRARRQLVRPEDVGLPSGGRRRVAGLRRDEVAKLAGISNEYYQRLEQGRDRHPSEPVLDGLARALLLEGDAAQHLRELASYQPAQRYSSNTPTPDVDPMIKQLIDTWSMTPAQVYVNRTLTVGAANPLAIALSPLFGPGHNALRTLFFEPQMRAFYRNWEQLTIQTVPYLRSLLGENRADPELVRLIGDLSAESEQFRVLWKRHDVEYNPRGVMLIKHPKVGDLDLHYQQLVLPNTGQVLIPYWAEPGSASEQRLQLLAGM